VGSDPLKHVSCHVLTAVDSLKKPGDKYIVDVGLGLPNFEPIPLDFEDETSLLYTHRLYHNLNTSVRMARSPDITESILL
jgi:hypothetical protein